MKWGKFKLITLKIAFGREKDVKKQQRKTKERDQITEARERDSSLTLLN